MITISITGRLGRDPDLKQLDSGAVLKLNVAVNDRVKKDGQWVDETHWFAVTMFGARAEGISKILQKGSRIGASGKLQPRTYTNKEGVEKVSLDLVAWDIEPLGDTKPKDDSQPRTSRPMPGQRSQHRDVPAYGHQGGGAGGPGYGGSQGYQAPYSPPPAQFGPDDSTFGDDDIPF